CPSSSTISVRTGTSSPSSGRSFSGIAGAFGGQIVVRDLVTAIDVVAVAAAPGLARVVVDGDDLEQALEAREVRRAFRRKIEKQLATRRRFVAGGDQHRGLRGERIVRRAVRNEADWRPGPPHPV